MLVDYNDIPYSDIESVKEFGKLQPVLEQMPNVEVPFRIFRIVDEMIISPDSGYDAISDNNSGLIVIPIEIIEDQDFSGGDDHIAFTKILRFIEQNLPPYQR